MLCMREQPRLPRQLHALPSESQRGSFALTKQIEVAGNLCCFLPSVWGRIPRAQPQAAAGEQVAAQP